MNVESEIHTTNDDHLTLNGVDLVDLSGKYGTPLFVFDEKRFVDNYRRFHTAVEKYHSKNMVCYSIKTNYNLAVCKRMREEDSYAEVASGLDLHVAQQVGFPADHLVFDGLYKPEEVLREAVNYGVRLINAESFSELNLINKVAGQLGKKQSVGIRVSTFAKKRFNPEDLYCNPLSRFGFSYEDAYEIFRKASEFPNLDINGLMTHPYWGIHTFLPFARRIQTELDRHIEYINFGGGYEKGSRKIGLQDLFKDMMRQKLGLESDIDSVKAKPVRSIEEMARRMVAEVGETIGKDHTLIFEPGRYLIHDAGILLVKAGVVKSSAGFKWVVVDGGTNLISDYLERRDIVVANHANSPPEEIVNVVGPLLFARDFVTIKKKLPRIAEGDVLAVFNSGAYTLSSSTQFLNPRPAAVLINGNGEITEARRRESYDYILQMDERS